MKNVSNNAAPTPPVSPEQSDLQSLIAELRELVSKLQKPVEDVRVRTAGLMGYEGLRDRLSIDGKRLSLRQVKRIVARYDRVIRPVKLGHRLVGFRPSRVEALVARLAGDEPVASCVL